MTENTPNRTGTIAVVTGIVALFLGLCLGGVMGAAAGYLIGRGAPARGLPDIRVPDAAATPRSPRSTPEGIRPGAAPATGALIQQVVTGSPADEAGLRRNEMITQVGNVTIDATHRLADELAKYKPGDTVKLTVWRAGATRTVDARLGKHPDDATRAYLGVQYAEVGVPAPTPKPGN